MIPTHPLLDTKSAIERMGDEEIYLEIARYFAANVSETAASLQQALESGALQEATRFAHSMKGNAATVGAETLRALCLQMEQTCRSGDAETAKELFKQLMPLLQEVCNAINSL